MKPISPTRKRLTIALTLIILATLGLFAVVQHRLLVDLPRPDELYDYTSAPSTKIYDRHGTLLYEITDPHQGLHTPLELDEVPDSCIQATIATEDSSFYRNPGVDAWAIVRALYINFKGGEVLSGGSTITQQLARNLLLSPEERTEISLTRKLREAILAWRLARTYSKDEILTLYLNETYYGNLAYGIEAASRTYFGKHAAELDLAECALLAGLPQSPATYNPLEDLAAAKARQSVVLDLMAKAQFLSADQADSARREKLGFAAVPFPIEAPHFVMYVRGQLERRYGLEAIYRQGLEVYTTLDLDMQNTAQRFAQLHLAELAEQKDGEAPRVVRNAAVVVLDPRSGEVLAMLGSPDYFDPRIDGAVNATTALRQPGSSIKPITYAAAFDPAIAEAHGYKPLTAASMMVDVRTAFVTKEGQPYVPENYDRIWRGPVLLRQSLASSYNLIAVKVLDYVGLDAMTGLARAMGITTFDNKDFGLALTLGGGEVRLLELTAAYGAFANGGRRVEPVTISRITDHAGQVLYETPKTLNPGPAVMDARTAYLITDILSDNYARRSTFGAGSPLRLDRPAAAKTGTTQDWRDNWTVGYTPEMVVGVWVGNADNEPMRHVSGVTGAAPIWRDVTQQLLKTHPAREFPQPPGLIEATVCAINGLLPVERGSGVRGQEPGARSQGPANSRQPTADSRQPTADNLPSPISNPQPPISNLPSSASPNSSFITHYSSFPTSCPHTLTEQFIPGTEPHAVDTWHQAIAIDRRTGLRAGPGCSPEVVTLRTYTRYPAEAAEWAIKQGVPQPPEQYSPLCPAGETETNVEVEGASGEGGLVFVSPDQGTVLRLVPNIPLDKQKIRIQVRPVNGVTVSDVALLINGQPLAPGYETLWQMEPGRYTFEAVGVDP
ncbi:MAG: PBP1A family penicillin-binding protein, partial [Anaerolineae bacterium]|nr:PBP1A family penicillin-binding protein [Anaerolineae bacterium]